MPTAPSSRAEPLSKKAYREIREWILTGELRPGERISLRPVAKSLGMSLAPVGEAVRELSHTGLVEIERGWGARVRQLQGEALRAQHILRTAVECEAIRQVAAAGANGRLSELREIATALDEAIASVSEPSVTRDLDSKFHLSIARASGVQSLVETLEKNQIVRLLAVGSELASGLGSPERQHLILVDAIEAGDPVAASDLMREHCVRSMQLQLDAAGA